MEYVSSLGVGTWPQWGTFFSMAGILVGLVTVWIKGIPARLLARTDSHRQIAAAEEALRADLMQHIEELRLKIAALQEEAKRDRHHCAEEREIQQKRHMAELQVLRHELANEEAALDAFLLLAEANPDKVMDQIPKIREMRQRHKDRIALEKGAIAGAAINAKAEK